MRKAPIHLVNRGQRSDQFSRAYEARGERDSSGVGVGGETQIERQQKADASFQI